MTTRKIGLAALLGLMSVLAFAAPAFASGPCGTGPMIDWDADAFAYETNYANLTSQPASNLSMVGIINLFCAPLDFLNPQDPTTEYTFVFLNLVSQGTSIIPVGPVTVFDTNYDQGLFFIYESPRNSPGALTPMPANPPNASVPANFSDGTVILSGVLNNFNTNVTVGAAGPSGQFRGDYRITGGTLFGLFPTQDNQNGLFHGVWCAPVVPNGTTCNVQTGYSAHVDGKFDEPLPPTPVNMSTWGAIKALYR